MKKQSYIVIGLSDFGKQIVLSLSQLSIELLVIDKNPKELEEIADNVLNTICADAADPDVLIQLGISSFDGAVVDTGRDLESKVLITMQLKELGVPRIIVKASNELEGRVLRRVGADRVVQPDREMGFRLANQIAGGKTFESIELPQKYSITDYAVPADWFEKSVQEIEVRTKYGVTMLGVHRGDEFLVNPSPELTLQSGDIAVLLGEIEQIDKLDKMFN